MATAWVLQAEANASSDSTGFKPLVVVTSAPCPCQPPGMFSVLAILSSVVCLLEVIAGEALPGCETIRRVLFLLLSEHRVYKF
ncbi:hypothetical protein FKM82_021124 [Ascaphus truei]